MRITIIALINNWLLIMRYQYNNITVSQIHQYPTLQSCDGVQH